jgi:RNA recognition motif-containing protein
MTETFVKNAFEKLGEAPMGVKIMRNKFTGEPAGYCFVHFKTDEIALDAMHKLNGKVIPASNPVGSFVHQKNVESTEILCCFAACTL